MLWYSVKELNVELRRELDLLELLEFGLDESRGNYNVQNEYGRGRGIGIASLNEFTEEIPPDVLELHGELDLLELLDPLVLQELLDLQELQELQELLELPPQDLNNDCSGDPRGRSVLVRTYGCVVVGCSQRVDDGLDPLGKAVLNDFPFPEFS